MTEDTGRDRSGSPVAARPGTSDTRRRDSHDDSPDDLLEVLGDEYTRTVLEAVLDRPRSGAEVADVTPVSKATAFRRLNELVDRGLVETKQCLDTNEGHHHKQYRAVIEAVSVTFGDDGIEISVETEPSTRTQALSNPRVIAND